MFNFLSSKKETPKDQESASPTVGSSSQSNQKQVAEQPTVSLSTQLKNTFQHLVDGQMVLAQKEAHTIAETARSKGDVATAGYAGNLWTIAHNLSLVQGELLSKNAKGVKEKASQSADLLRMLIAKGVVDASIGDKILSACGGYWKMAESLGQETTTSQQNNAANKAKNSQTVDQHRLPSSRNWAYCGVATSLMMLQANGKSNSKNVAQDMNTLAGEMYSTGNGTDVDAMAASLRRRGLDKSTSTRNGTFAQLIASLDKGQPVPFGITHSTGTITSLNSKGSARYPQARKGDRHYKKFGNSGHWVLIVGYQGSKEKPSHFVYNDPDLGGQITATTAEISSMGTGNGNFYQVYQK